VPGIEARVLQPRQPLYNTANEYLDELERRAGVVAARTTGWRYYTEVLAKWAIKSIGRPQRCVPADFEGRSFAAMFDSSKAERQLAGPVKDRETLIRKGVHIPVDEFFR